MLKTKLLESSTMLKSLLSALHATQHISTNYIPCNANNLKGLQFHSNNKNKRYSLGSREDFLPHSHRLQYIFKDTGCFTITIIYHHIP